MLKSHLFGLSKRMTSPFLILVWLFFTKSIFLIGSTWRNLVWQCLVWYFYTDFKDGLIFQYFRCGFKVQLSHIFPRCSTGVPPEASAAPRPSTPPRPRWWCTSQGPGSVAAGWSSPGPWDSRPNPGTKMVENGRNPWKSMDFHGF